MRRWRRAGSWSRGTSATARRRSSGRGRHGPRSSFIWRRRSTCASRSPTPPSMPRSNSAATPNGPTALARPRAPSGQSSAAPEGYLPLYERLYGLSGVSLRLGNVYGPRQDPLGEAGVIAIFCGRLRAGGRPTVFGDGTQTRDYLYVGDVVAAGRAAGRS